MMIPEDEEVNESLHHGDSRYDNGQGHGVQGQEVALNSNNTRWGPQSLRNAALVFVKPHACNDAVKEYVRQKLEDAGMVVRHEIDISGSHMDRMGIIDTHYYAISEKAVTVPPSKLKQVPTEEFYKKFSEVWGVMIQQKRLLNAKEASERFTVNGEELYQMWKQAEEAGDVLKLAGGFYVAKLQYGNEPKPYYVINGFYLRLREKFTIPEAMVHGLDVEWNPQHLSWKDFRSRIIGATDPSKAMEGSIRRALFDNYADFGLEVQPNISDNGVHGSASPLEALSEKRNWLGGAAAAGNQSASSNRSGNIWSVRNDSFGRALVSQGLTESLLVEEYFKDPLVTLPGGTQKMSLFDAVEDTDAPECYEKLIAIYDRQLEQAYKSEAKCDCTLL